MPLHTMHRQAPRLRTRRAWRCSTATRCSSVRAVLRRTAPILVAIVCSAVPQLAHAGGFYVPEIGPRAVGMAGAVVADPHDGSAIFHNPAGLAGQRGTQVQVAGSLFFGNVQFYRRPVDNPLVAGETIRFDRVRNTNKLGGAPLLAISSDFGVRDLAVGIGVYAPFGAGLEFPENGAQRHIVTAVHLRTIYVTPTIAYRFFDRLSIGVGLSYVYADLGIDQVNAVPFVTGDPSNIPIRIRRSRAPRSCAAAIPRASRRRSACGSTTSTSGSPSVRA